MNNQIRRNMTIDNMASIHHNWVKDNGFGDENAQGVLTLIQKAALVSIDLQKNHSVLGRRLASVILLALDIAKHNEINIDYEIVSKMISNAANDNLKNRSK